MIQTNKLLLLLLLLMIPEAQRLLYNVNCDLLATLTSARCDEAAPMIKLYVYC